MAGEDEGNVETAHFVQGVEAARKRMRFGLGPQPDIRCDPEQYLIRGKENAPRLVVEHELMVSKAGRMDDSRSPIPSVSGRLDLIATAPSRAISCGMPLRTRYS